MIRRIARTGASPVSGGPHWDGLSNGCLLLPRCARCSEWNALANRFCAACGSPDLSWRATEGRGRLVSYSIIYQAPYPAFASKVPYTVAVIELCEGPRTIARLTHTEGLGSTHIGRGVRLVADPAARGLASFSIDAFE